MSSGGVAAVFRAMDAAIRTRGAEFVDKVRGVVHYRIKRAAGADAVWTVDLKTGTGKVAEGASGTADLEVTANEDTFVDMATGALSPQQAFMKGKLKLKGNMGLAMKLTTVIEAARKANPDLAKEIAAQAQPSAAAPSAPAPAAPKAAAPAAPAAPAASAGSEPLATGLKSSPIFEEIRNHVRANGKSLVSSVKGIIEFHINGAVVTVDLKTAEGAVYAGATKAGAKPDLVMTVSDDDFVDLSLGTLNPQMAFMRGKLKLKGNIALAMKLNTVLAAARPKPKL
jgi:putative sterol carrier protein